MSKPYAASETSQASSVADLDDERDSEVGFRNDSNCFICNKSLTGLMTQRHHCRFCGNTVCGKHSSNKRKKQGRDKPSRICDRCNEEVLQEEVKDDILKEVNTVRKKILDLKTENELLAKENNDRSLRIKNIDYEFDSVETAHKAQMAALADKIAEEDQRGSKLRTTVESMQRLIDESNELERKLNAQYLASEAEVEKLRSEIKVAKQEKDEISEQLGYLNTRLKTGVSISEVLPILCVTCRRKVDGSSERLVAGP
jgi:DNA repair exonuclease SbcCD ATPase subunit